MANNDSLNPIEQQRRRSVSSDLSDAPVAPVKSTSPDHVSFTLVPKSKVRAGPSTKASASTASKKAEKVDKKTKQIVDHTTIVPRRRIFWGRKNQSECEYDVEGSIKDDWQVAYVWAFLIRFRRDNIPDEADRFEKTNVVNELKTIDEFEQSLQSEVPDESLIEALLVLVRPLWRTATEILEEKEKKDQAKKKEGKSKYRPSKALASLRETLNSDNVIEKLSNLIETRLQPGSPLSIFDAYVFEKTEFYWNEEDAKEADALAAEDSSTLEYRAIRPPDIQSDRSDNNPLKSQGFWGSTWSAKIKILRQLVDWNLLDPDVHDMLTQSRSKPKTTNTYEVERTDKGTEGLHWQMIENTYRVYAIKKPLHINAPTFTVASSKDEYLALMNRHLDKQKDIPELKKEAALASTKAKKTALKNKAILAERDVDFGKVLESRLGQIEEQYQTFERQRHELVLKKERAAERAAREARRIAAASQVVHGTRATRSRAKVNYAEDQAEDDEEVQYSGRLPRSGIASDGGDYQSSPEAEIVVGRATRNSRTAALTNASNGAYATRGATASTFDERDDGQSMNGYHDEDADQHKESETESSSEKGTTRKRGHSNVDDDDEEDLPPAKRAHVSEENEEDQSVEDEENANEFEEE